MSATLIFVGILGMVALWASAPAAPQRVRNGRMVGNTFIRLKIIRG